VISDGGEPLNSFVRVEGTRLIAVILSYAQTPRADLDLAQNVIDTLDIEP
jgi:hypothetical protein